jgi:hypothetical protein
MRHVKPRLEIKNCRGHTKDHHGPGRERNTLLEHRSLGLFCVTTTALIGWRTVKLMTGIATTPHTMSVRGVLREAAKRELGDGRLHLMDKSMLAR